MELMPDPPPPLHPEIAKTLVQCGDEVEQQWLYDGAKFSPPPPSAVEDLPIKSEARELAEALIAKGVVVEADLPEKLRPGDVGNMTWGAMGISGPMGGGRVGG
jgi:hypothetical protein